MKHLVNMYMRSTNKNQQIQATVQVHNCNSLNGAV